MGAWWGRKAELLKIVGFHHYFLRPGAGATKKEEFQGRVWDPPGRDIGRGKPLLRRRKGKSEDQYV